MKPNGALAPLGVVTVMVYTLVPLLAGRVVGIVWFQRSCVAPVWKLPGCMMIELATAVDETTSGTGVPFRKTWTAVMSLAPVKLVPPSCTPWLFAPLV